MAGKGFRNQSLMFRTAVIFLAAVAITGAVLIADGLYIKAKAELSQVLLKHSFEQKLAGNGDGRPWPWADFTVAAEISVPRLQKSGIVISGASGQGLAFGPAWLNASPLPGAEGTSVIAAHRDTHFVWLKDVRPDDLIVVKLADGKTYEFRAHSGRVARWDDNGINIAAIGHHLALATCWPFDAKTRGPLRYILDAELVAGPDTSVAMR